MAGAAAGFSNRYTSFSPPEDNSCFPKAARAADSVVTAQAEKVNGYGRIDIYVRGGHWASLAVRRNRDLIVGSCEPDHMRGREENMTFYPFRDQKKP